MVSDTEAQPGRNALEIERKRLKTVAVWLLLCLIWGSTWIFIKMGLRDLPPLSFAGIRFVIAAILLAIVAAVRRSALPRGRREWTLLAWTGLLSFSINYGLLFWGEQYVSSGLAALLQATIPLFGLVFASRQLPEERMSATKLAGVSIGLAGVAVIFSNQLGAEGPAAFRGSAAILIGAAAVAYSNVLVKAHATRIAPEVLAACQMVFGLLPLLAFGFVLEGNPLRFAWTGLGWVCLLYLAFVGSAVAFLAYYWLVKHMDVTKTMLIALVTPFVAVLIGIIVLGEQINWQIALGGLAIVAGISLVIRR
ncbi:MAG TPA: EamA family transporter [Blastocatellia bacterium]|nr:EamA family transporter [Blastocatellia bacterium]